jgi:hypothetical protein
MKAMRKKGEELKNHDPKHEIKDQSPNMSLNIVINSFGDN